MLVIRRAQLRSLEPADWWRPWIRGHLARHFPVQVAALGEDGIGRIIELGEQGARSHGFSAGSHICLFIDLMVLLGEGFDRDPALPWAAAILAERDRDDEDRSCRLADRAARHLDGLG